VGFGSLNLFKPKVVENWNELKTPKIRVFELLKTLALNAI